MNILFVSLIDFDSFEQRNIYTDLLRGLIKQGHTIYAVSPVERRQGKETRVICDDGGFILKQRIGNIQKVNHLEKGISTLLIDRWLIRGIQRAFAGVKFDLILYATPPVTLARVIRYFKKRDGAKTYLMLKDIFPQNSVDIGVLSTHGIKGLIFHYFRHKEKQLYALSDTIGCMSPANLAYVLAHNPEIDEGRVEVFPNSIEPLDMRVTPEEKMEIRREYGLPINKRIFVYGGNLGAPQDVPFIVECLKATEIMAADVHFVIAGSGTDRHFLETYVSEEKPPHVTLMNHLPKEAYDRMVAGCDVGLIFLDHRFTIPNFPSRLLSYMQAGLPVLACTDKHSDVGQVITEAGFGWWCESRGTDAFRDAARRIAAAELSAMADSGWNYLNKNYSVQVVLERLHLS